MATETEPKKEITVFISNRDSTCGECGENLGSHAWITLAGEKGALCLTCADLEHLVFLPSGDPALTRRSKKYSALSAVVLKWSRSRQRYERQGLLVEEEALDQAEKECLDDSESRKLRQGREAEKREIQDRQYLERFTERIREIFPKCPAPTAIRIAEHACLKYSGRVGRSAAAKDLDEKAVRLAVAAHIRHTETDYDRLLASGWDRHDARSRIAPDLTRVLAAWEGSD